MVLDLLYSRSDLTRGELTPRLCLPSIGDEHSPLNVWKTIMNECVKLCMCGLYSK